MTDLRAIGYIRISKEEKDGGKHKQAGPEVQRHAIERECERHDWQLVNLYEDIGVSGGTQWEKRPGASAAIHAIEAGEADILICSKLDRLSRGLMDFADILARSRRNGWRVDLLDFGLDTSKPTGRMVAHVLAAVAEWERERIGERTREALAEKRRQGVRLGRPPSTDPKAVAAILAMRHDGLMFREIADGMNGLDFPTPQGARRWTEESVRLAYHAAKAGRLPAAVLESSS